MRLQVAAFKIKFHESVIYRSNVLINFFFGCVPLFVSILLWKAIYGTEFSEIGNYSYSQMITYYVLVFLCSQILDARDNTVKISEMIRDGSMHNFMLKPIDFICYNFKLFFAEKVLYVINISIPFAIFVTIISMHVYWEMDNVLFFLISLCLAFFLKYLIGCILGFLTIWIEEISGLLDLWDNIEAFLAGGVISLTLFPVILKDVVAYLPFKYTLFVPIDIYMGNLSYQEVLIAVEIQILWCVILGSILHLVRKMAKKKYSGYGS